LKLHHAVELPQALRWMLQLCEALHEAHGYGLVHRDIKPANLIVVRLAAGDLAIKLVDFGLAKSLSPRVDESLTETGILVGSPAYMSPELVRGARVTPQSDIWSLGVVLYELLSGRRPFDGDSASAILAAIVADPPTPLHEVAAGCPALVHAIVERCLCKAPADRFGSVEELASRLDTALAELEGEGPVVGATGGETSATISQVLLASGDFRDSVSAAKRRRRPLMAVLTTGLALTAGLWWISSRVSDRGGDATASGSSGEVGIQPADSASSTLHDSPRRPEVGPARKRPPPTDAQPVLAERPRIEQGSRDVAAPARPGPRRRNPASASASARRVPFLFEEPDF
jgi:serine/threonine protein kinase